MKVGDLVESHKGSRGIVIESELMYPNHRDSPVGRVRVHWQTEPPEWTHPGLFFSVLSLRKITNENR